jgi:hypothetical protein
MNTDWYFTAPWDSAPIRRGDALGLRAGADYFADLLAPGLSNGTSDARWISLLSWCLKWSHVAWESAGGGDLSRRDDQRARYAWLRPLELLWLDRTLEAEQTTGQLRGRRSVERWRKADRKTPNFTMSPDQFRRYRQVGTYGAYRVVFRTVEGLTTGDGWTPAKTALKLADLVNKNLPKEARLKEEYFENSNWKWGSWRDQEARFWAERGWSEWRTKPSQGLLPTPNEDKRVCESLPENERSILAPVLFGEESVRHKTAKVLASATHAQSHVELCDALAGSNKFDKETQAKLALLPAFTRLADAAMDAMRTLWHVINHDGKAQAPTIEKIARSGELKEKFEQLKDMSEAWLGVSSRSNFPHQQIATQLAEAMQNADTLVDQIRALTKHHTEHGGGRRWFQEQAGALVPLVADTGIAASDYRFRLRTICLLAAQCGIAKMDNALEILLNTREDDENGDDE